MESKTALIAVIGPTATGKSALGVHLALALGGEIISCDSTAVYRGVDIGTDKPSLADRAGVPHHLIDVAEPTEIYSAARYAADAAAAIRDIRARGRFPILVGGTGFYYRALARGQGVAAAAVCDRRHDEQQRAEEVDGECHGTIVPDRYMVRPTS